MQEVLWYH